MVEFNHICRKYVELPMLKGQCADLWPCNLGGDALRDVKCEVFRSTPCLVFLPAIMRPTFYNQFECGGLLLLV